MSNIIATGFNVGSDDGEFASLEADLRALADMGVDTVELGVTSLDLIAGGRIIQERHERLLALTRQFDFRYTVHGLVSSNFMDPVTQRYQIDAAKALVEVCNRIGARHPRAAWRQPARRARSPSGPVPMCASAKRSPNSPISPARMACASRFENIFTTELGQYRQTPAEVAETVKAVNHPNVVALIDFSHAYIESDLSRASISAPQIARHGAGHRAPARPRFASAARRASTSRSIRRKTPRWALATCTCRSAGAISPGTRSSPNSTFLPDTVAMMEIGRRYRREQPASLARAKALAGLSRRADRSRRRVTSILPASSGRRQLALPSSLRAPCRQTRGSGGMGFGISGVYCAAVTPLNADLSPDLSRIGEHCLGLLADGCHGIALLGTTGEANSFSVAERKAILEAALKAGVTPDQLAPGVGVAAIPDTVELIRHALASASPAW